MRFNEVLDVFAFCSLKPVTGEVTLIWYVHVTSLTFPIMSFQVFFRPCVLTLCPPGENGTVSTQRKEDGS